MNMDKISEALTGWIAPDTWHTGHPTDTQRFYDFVKELCDARFMDKERLRKMITEEVRNQHPAFNPDETERVVDEKIELSGEIYDYVMHVG